MWAQTLLLEITVGTTILEKILQFIVKVVDVPILQPNNSTTTYKL